MDDVLPQGLRILRHYRWAPGQQGLTTPPARLGEATENLRDLANPDSLAGREFGENISGKVSDLVDTLRSVSQPLANVRRDAAESIGAKLNELSDSLKTLSDSSATSGKELASNISRRISDLTDTIDAALSDQRDGRKKATGQG